MPIEPEALGGLLEAGLLYPDLGTAPVTVNGTAVAGRSVKDFEQWLAQSSPERLAVFAHPLATTRALGEDLGLPDLRKAESSDDPSLRHSPSSFQEADGLEWPLRLAVLWQQVASSPLRSNIFSTLAA